jgi:subtilisin family serine protease
VAEYQWAAERLKLFGAWEKVRGTAFAAVLDNGIQIHGLPASPGTHPDLSANYRQQFSRNFDLNNGPNGSANTATNLDEEPYTVTISGVTYTNIAGHGSHTAGVLAARGNNGIGVSGTCQLCALLVGRISVWDAMQQRLGVSAQTYTAGVAWMTNAGAQVINNSFRIIDPSSCTHPGASGTPCAALDAAHAQDVVVVAASGNARTSTIDFPASY